MAPGPMLFTVMLYFANSTAIVRASIRNAALEAQYTAFVGIGKSSCTEEMLIILPPSPCWIICFAAA